MGNPRSKTPPLDGVLDFLRSPRSKTPPLEGVLDILRSPRSKTPPWRGCWPSWKVQVPRPPLGPAGGTSDLFFAQNSIRAASKLEFSRRHPSDDLNKVTSRAQRAQKNTVVWPDFGVFLAPWGGVLDFGLSEGSMRASNVPPKRLKTRQNWDNPLYFSVLAALARSL